MPDTSSESVREFAAREAERAAAEQAQRDEARQFLKCSSGIADGMTDPYEKLHRRDYEEHCRQLEQETRRVLFF